MMLLELFKADKENRFNRKRQTKERTSLKSALLLLYWLEAQLMYGSW